MNRLILLVESRIRGDVYVRFGGELPKTHRSNTAGRWMLSLPLKTVNNLIGDAYKVKEIILMVGDITDIYVTGYRSMLKDPNYSPEELSAMASGYAKLLEMSGESLKELKTLLKNNALSMNDKERMELINRIYDEVREYRAVTSYFTQKNISVSFVRAAEKGELERVNSLYGSGSSRYW